jgi:DNA invertase Pin-like site-specific DNA recombinase
MILTLKLNERGCRIGDSHHRAVLTDHEVMTMRDMRDGGASYRELARSFEVALGTAWRICACEIRAQTVAQVKRLRVP